MGYTTDFTGRFDLDKPLELKHIQYLDQFASTRRMQRRSHIAEKYTDPLRHAVGLPIGEEGEYYVGAERYSCDSDQSVIDHNKPPVNQPGLWCNWVPTEDGLHIEWNGGEKFYHYIEWLKYLIEHFLKPWGYSLSGTVKYQGEDPDDKGVLIFADNIQLNIYD
jgi:hypothetical protein